MVSKYKKCLSVEGEIFFLCISGGIRQFHFTITLFRLSIKSVFIEELFATLLSLLLDIYIIRQFYNRSDKIIHDTHLSLSK